ncbi:MAG: helix-turn-helix domain-containing protein, partial [Candidatus Cryptobacteroides sp.]
EDGYVSRPDSNWGKETDVDIQEEYTGNSNVRDIDPEGENYSLHKVNEELIRKALERHNGNRKKAAEELGISERTLYRKIPPEFRNQRKSDD